MFQAASASPRINGKRACHSLCISKSFGNPIRSSFEYFAYQLTMSLEDLEPLPGRRNILITSALPYVNNVPHLGNIIGCVLSGDVYARFCRMRGHVTLYVCGTDEYGTATEIKAIQEKLTPQEICDKYHEIHKNVYNWFGISFDKFGRTSTRQQTEITQEIWTNLERNGLIYEEEVQQLFCGNCSRFLSDRYVRGVCPDCGYEDAQGDQCDKCGHLLEAVSLIEPRCWLCGNRPVAKASKQMFLDLPKISDRLTEFIELQSVEGKWSANSISTAKAWLKTGLKARCITRDLKWGTAIPKDGYENKVFYVWFDAPIGYISITASATKHWEKWWKNNRQESSDTKVELVQFMGKDNVPFHTVIFPCTLLGAGEEEGFTLLHHISTTEYLNYETGKFSKSRGVGVFGDTIQQSGIPVEVWRYYLLINRPEQADTVFMWEDFQLKNNSELLKNLGNFVNRSLKFVEKEFDSLVPKVVFSKDDEKFIEELDAKILEYVDALENVKIKQGLKIAMLISSMGNQYMQHNTAWELIKSPETKDRAASVTALCANIVALLAILTEPYMPSFTENVLHQLNLDNSVLNLESSKFKILVPEGHKIGKPAPLFSRIDDAAIKKLREFYNGSQDQEKTKENSQSEFPLELMVGRVVRVNSHPSAEHLYVIEVRFGANTAPREIVSGLVQAYKPEELLDQLVVVVMNLKPAAFRGVKSNGMVLCAQDTEMTILTVGDPSSAESYEGKRIFPEGISYSEGNTWPSLDSKKLKSIMKKADFKLNESNQVESAGKPLLVFNADLSSAAPVRTQKKVSISSRIS